MNWKPEVIPRLLLSLLLFALGLYVLLVGPQWNELPPSSAIIGELFLAGMLIAAGAAVILLGRKKREAA